MDFLNQKRSLKRLGGVLAMHLKWLVSTFIEGVDFGGIWGMPALELWPGSIRFLGVHVGFQKCIYYQVSA